MPNFVKPLMETNVSWGSSAKPLWRARPPSNFLVGADLHAVMRCCHGHHPYIQSNLLHDRKGEGNEKRREERSVSVVNGEMIVIVATRQE